MPAFTSGDSQLCIYQSSTELRIPVLFFFTIMIANTQTHSQLLKSLDEVGALVGNTPLMPIRNVWRHHKVQLFAKLEWHQLGQSVKARAAYYIIRDALLSGKWYPGKRLLDATSGNTGIAYASIAARLSVPLTICLPQNASTERKQILKALGAELIYTSPLESTDGSQDRAKALAEGEPEKYLYLDQYNNDQNWKAHYYTTGQEVYHQTQGAITHFATGLGTSGTFMGTSRRLKEINPAIQVVSMHPESVLHGLEGWKDMATAKIPGIYDPSLADERLAVSTEEAYDFVERFAKAEGMLISPSAGANLAGAIKLAKTLEEGIIVTVFPDDYSKYSEVIQQIFPS
ncbi:MAG: PLP-dependent cysteine synthase family protein [Bacteroidia bacterium]